MQPSISSAHKILKPDRDYTFADYFKLRFSPSDILAELGCTLQRQRLNLAGYEGEVGSLDDLRQRIEDTLPHISLTSEMARRELLIAPVVIELIRTTGADLNIEYPIEVSPQLKGDLDYFLVKNNRLLIIEAKQADLTRGFTQLAVELIALHQWLDQDAPGNALLTGAVTTGDVWQFGHYNPATQEIFQDLSLLRVPDDLERLFRILVNVLM